MATYAGKLKVGGTELPIGSTLYGTCATAAATAAKVVTMANFDKLITGVTIHVKFTYSNTVANPTLNVNSTGAKTIYRYGTTAPSTSVATSWNAGAVVAFTYDGTYWQMNDWNNTDNNTTYGLSISDHTVSLVAGGTTSSVTVPDNNTTYSAGTGLSLSSTTFNHSNSVTAGTAGTSSATSGSTLAVPYVTYDAQGHVTASGTHTHTVSGFLTSHQTIKQDGVTGATVNRYGACTTAAATAAKTVSVTTGTFNLEAGARVSVKFNNANTANSPTLNVNSNGAKNIFHKGAQITSGGNKALLAGICDFIYDGTQWHLVGNYIDTDNNTTYGLSISGHTVSLVSGGTTSSVTVPDNNTTYTANTTSIGSASGWSAGTAASASVANGVLTITNGTKPALTVTSTTVATGITAS